MQARQVRRVGAQAAGLAEGGLEQRAEAPQEAGLLLAFVGVGGFEQEGGEALLEAFDALYQRRQAVALGEVVDDGQHLAALAGEHQPRDVQAAAQFVVGQGLLEGQEDETALRLAVHGGGQSRRARLELLAGVGLEAGAALHQQPEGVMGAMTGGDGFHRGRVRSFGRGGVGPSTGFG